MRTILVTGASGRIGKAVTAELDSAGFTVKGTDRPADLGDPAVARELLQGCDGVVHLAAYPGPRGRPGRETFANNVLATFHVLEAAVELGIRNAVIASSVSAYGMSWAHRPFSPEYVPFDEDHPMLPQEAYGLSKQVDEQTAAMLWRGHDLTVVAMRFHWVATQEQILARRASLTTHEAHEHGASELWGYIEIGDAARACRLGLDAPPGFHPLNIVAPDTLSDVPTADLLARWHPDTVVRTPIEGTATPYSIERAEKLLGFVPHSYRTPDGNGSSS